jgi:transposase
MLVSPLVLAGGERGYDAGNKVAGRKHTLLVDTSGLVLRVLVHPANIQDSEGAEWLLANFRDDFPTLKLIWVDQGYKDWIVDAAKTYYAVTLEQVHKPKDQVGFAVQPRRWVVERAFAWLGRGRRLSKDYEMLAENSEAVVYIDSIRLMLKRLTSLCYLLNSLTVHLKFANISENVLQRVIPHSL